MVWTDLSGLSSHGLQGLPNKYVLLEKPVWTGLLDKNANHKRPWSARPARQISLAGVSIVCQAC